MVRSRLGLKVLGLCALALGLMAFIASAAQAEATSHWNVAKKSVTGAEEFQLEIKELEGGTANLAFTTKSGTKVKILCTVAKFDEGGKLIKEGGLSLGRILFTNCVTLLNGALSPPCKPKTTGKALGEILSERGKGLITLDEVGGVKQDYVKIVPEDKEGKASTLFAPIEMGEECAIGTLVKVEAKSAGEGLWIKDCGKINAETNACEESNAGFTTEKPTHLIRESLEGLIALGQPAKIEGSAVVQLTGGLTNWSGTPG
jgi:hypothetical protein